MTATVLIMLGGESGLAAALAWLASAWARKHWVPAFAEPSEADAPASAATNR